MADFPGGVYTPRTKANKTGVVYTPARTTIGYAEDVSKLDAEVVAIETELNNAITRVYADNTAAKAGGLTNGQFYRTGDVLKIVHS